jgi:DNA-directed RNA polymerase specialized sigma24 family protein
MIDSFWTKRRIKRLAGGDTLLVGKWLEDYAGWIYGRAWYCCQGDQTQAQQILEETFVSAAGRMNGPAKTNQTMGEWLLSVFEQTAADGHLGRVTEMQASPEIQKAVRNFSTQALLKTEFFWPELVWLGQQALAMLSRDEQEVLVCRYVRLEGPADIAAKYGLAISEVQTLLYKARHSFRRILELLTQAGAEEASQPAQADLAALEGNLEKVFCAMAPKPTPGPQALQQLKERVMAIAAQNRPRGWRNFNKKKVCVGCGIAALCGTISFFALWGGTSSKSKEKTGTQPNGSLRTRENGRRSTASNSTEDIQLAFELGAAQNIEGLLGILRTGSYPAQIVAAYYLGQFGDKTAIDLLDQAAQKWYAENPMEKNPFIEAIAAIEGRMREQMRDALRKAQIPPEPRPVAREPNFILKEQTAVEEPNTLPTQKTSATEPNKPQREPNYTSAGIARD